MSVNSKMTAIADKIRSLLGINGKLGLDAMDTNLESANTEVATQEELMEEILTTLAEKSANTGETAKPEQEKTIDITENGTTEVLPDSGKVLSKVTVNVEVASGEGSGEDNEWVEDNSEIVYKSYCYQNLNISLEISKNGTATYKRDIREVDSSYYPNQKPQQSCSNLNTLINSFENDLKYWVDVKQAEIVNVENATNGEIITVIGTSAFFGAIRLKRVKLASTIKELGSYAFSYCVSLEDIDIPQLATALPAYCFASCHRLNNVNGIENITSIGDKCFDGCISLQSIITFNNALITIGADAFRYCGTLEKIIFLGKPSGTLSQYAFSSCVNIKDIYVPWSESEVANSPWGAVNATIHYNTTYDENHNPIV